MLNFFRTNQLTNAFLFIFYIALLRCATFFFPELRIDAIADGGYFTNIVSGWFSTGFWGGEIFMIFLLSLQAFFLSYVISEHRMAREVSLFTGVFYLLISASSSYYLPMSGVILANTFLIFALWALLNTYRVPACADTIFNIGFWIAIATFFEVSYIIFLIWGVFGLNYMRALKLKEILTVFAGFITPYILVSVWHFWFDNYDVFWQQHLYENFKVSQFTLFGNIWQNISLGFMALLTIISVMSSGEYFKKKGIQVQKRISVVFLLMFTALGTVFFQGNFDASSLLVLSIPLSIFIGFNFINLSRPTASSLHLVWVVAAIVLQFRPIIFGG